MEIERGEREIVIQRDRKTEKTVSIMYQGERSRRRK
jgi:hypothetical protein